MKILAIETSCDDTGIAVLEVSGAHSAPRFKIFANLISSQTDLHATYGGVFPMMAKREHARNIVPLCVAGLKQSKLLKKAKTPLVINSKKLEILLEREPEMLEIFLKEIPKYEKPKLDRIAVTVGPGLEPTLWVGINFARALSLVWNIPVVPVNHMAGHILSVFTGGKKSFTIPTKSFPALSLLVSGGHTEIVLAKKIGAYTILGSTKDDAAGEAFDKVARMLGFPYPGGPAISAMADIARKASTKIFTLPRPMLRSDDYNFSFSGLKTAVLYTIRDHGKLSPDDVNDLCREFEDAAVEVLVHKTLRAVKEYKTTSVIVGGGVSANTHLRTELTKALKKENVAVLFPDKKLSTDNALMIAIAGYFEKANKNSRSLMKADGNLKL